LQLVPEKKLSNISHASGSQVTSMVPGL